MTALFILGLVLALVAQYVAARLPYTSPAAGVIRVGGWVAGGALMVWALIGGAL